MLLQPGEELRPRACLFEECDDEGTGDVARGDHIVAGKDRDGRAAALEAPHEPARDETHGGLRPAREVGEDGRVGAVEASRAGVAAVPVLGDSQRDDLVARLGEKVEDPLGFLGRDGEIAMDVDDGHRLALRRQLKDRVDAVLFAQRIDDGGVVACHADDPPLPRLGRERLGRCHGGVRSVELGDADVHDPGFRRRARADAPINRKVLAIEFH